MNQSCNAGDEDARTAHLLAFVETALHKQCAGRQVTEVRRRPSEYRSSFPLEELEVCFADGGHLALIFKDLSPRALPLDAERVKPAFLFDPLREVEVYRSILEPTQCWGPKLYGAIADPLVGRYWLLLEDVPGVELYQVGDLESWQMVVGWLAEMHRRLTTIAVQRADDTHLLRYDAEYFRRWPLRAAHFVGPSLSGDRAIRFERLLAGYDRVVERLIKLPATFIHGEFYASNVLLQPAMKAPRVWAVDWEMAGIGPGLIDLAAIMAGDWTAEQRRTLALTYYAAIGSELGDISVNAFLDALRYCRLHTAMQWLGWAPDWSPPVAHAHNWLAESLEIAEELPL